MSRQKQQTINHPEELVPHIGKAKNPKTAKPGNFLRILRRASKGINLARKITSGRGPGGGYSFVRAESKAYSQRVTVKARFVNLQTKGGVKGIIRHIRYLQREGVSETGTSGIIFNLEGEVSEKLTPKSLSNWSEDKHYWRFIVSPEFGDKLDLKAYAKELIQGMEEDLRTRLQYFFVPHYNTDKPHIHILIRGVRDDGTPLIISKDYVSNGIRFLAQKLATRELGPRLEKDVLKQQSIEVSADRFTTLDRSLLSLAAKNSGHIDLRLPGKGRAKVYRDLKLARLKHLRTLGLAQEKKAAVWILREDIEPILKRLSLRNDILKSLHSIRHGVSKDFAYLDPNSLTEEGILIRVWHQGLSDELNDTRYILGEGLDGVTYFTDLKNLGIEGLREPKVGDVIEIIPNYGKGDVQLLGRVANDMNLELVPKTEGVTFIDRLIVSGYSPSKHLNFGSFNRDLQKAFNERVEFLKSKSELKGEGNYNLTKNLLNKIYSEEIVKEARRILLEYGGSLSFVSATDGYYTFKGFEELPSASHGVFLAGNRLTLIPYKQDMKDLKPGDSVFIKITGEAHQNVKLTSVEAAKVNFKVIKRMKSRKGGKK